MHPVAVHRVNSVPNKSRSDAYQEATDRHEQGEHTMRVDEMTGIQALERAAPGKPSTQHSSI
jgi:uncharacterized protein YdbL (DUF1318 family)